MSEPTALTAAAAGRLEATVREAMVPGIGALSTFLDKMLSIGPVQVQTLSLVQLKREFPGGCLKLEAMNEQAPDEWCLLLVPQAAMDTLLVLLIGEEGAAGREAYSDMELTILEESLTQVAQPLTVALAQATGAVFTAPLMEFLPQGILTADFADKTSGSGLVAVRLGIRAATGHEFALYTVLPLSLASKSLTVKNGEEFMERKKDAGFKTSSEVEVQSVEFPNLAEADLPRVVGEKSAIDLIKDVALDITVELGRTKLPIKEVLALTTGSVVILDQAAGGAVDLLVNNKLYARGEVVVIDENFGVRITDILTPEERISNLDK
jgi:flagellar motor switch protein FliN/FliY